MKFLEEDYKIVNALTCAIFVMRRFFLITMKFNLYCLYYPKCLAFAGGWPSYHGPLITFPLPAAINCQ